MPLDTEETELSPKSTKSRVKAGRSQNRGRGYEIDKGGNNRTPAGSTWWKNEAVGEDGERGWVLSGKSGNAQMEWRSRRGKWLDSRETLRWRGGSSEESGWMVKWSSRSGIQTSIWVKIRLNFQAFVLISEQKGCSLDTRKSMNHVYNERFSGQPALPMPV